MFNENSVSVLAWVNLIRDKKFSREQVPALGNLREMVYVVLDANEE